MLRIVGNSTKLVSAVTKNSATGDADPNAPVVAVPGSESGLGIATSLST